MVNLLPAVLVGGPPHAGKSVLTYNLSQALRQKCIAHYVLRANPDGEGDWTQEAFLDTIRQLPPTKRGWTDDFRRLASRDIERRPLPLLVDLGGLPGEKEAPIFHACTHSLLLLHGEEQQSTQFWRHLVASQGLLPLADLYSVQEGGASLDTTIPTITGTISSLKRQHVVSNTVFDALVERISMLFGSYTRDELRKIHFDTAPTEPIDLDDLLHSQDQTAQRWKPTMLPQLVNELNELPATTAFSFYGRAPNWVYSTCALQLGKHFANQFDARIGWLTPPTLTFGTTNPAEIEVDIRPEQDVSVLHVRLMKNYLDYTEASQWKFPHVPTTHGLILSGNLPLWLWTALARLYIKLDMAYIACYQPNENGAVVVTSRVATHELGDVISMPSILT